MKSIRVLKFLTLILCTMSVQAQSWKQVGKDVDGENSVDHSGFSTSISADGQTMAIGAPNNSTDWQTTNKYEEGHVRIYKKGRRGWRLKGKEINGKESYDYSGSSVSLSADGNTVAIGSPNSDSNGEDAGEVTIYHFINSSWVQKGTSLNGKDPKDLFGTSVALSEDANTIIVSSPQNTNSNGINSGSSQIYKWDGTEWIQKGSDIYGISSYDQSGNTLSINDNGNIIAIGASKNSANRNTKGYVRTYKWDGTKWIKLGNVLYGEEEQDQFGSSVSLSQDGSSIAIGAIYNSGHEWRAGHTRIFYLNDNNWKQRGLDIDGEVFEDHSGQSVSLNHDGTLVAIGAPGNDGQSFSACGHVRIYHWNNTSWTQRGLDIDGESSLDLSGHSVSLSSNGLSIAIGAPGNSKGQSGRFFGHVRVYEWDGPTAVMNNGERNLINIYPNPNTGQFKVDLENSFSDAKIVITNILGEIIYEDEISGRKALDYRLSISTGIYGVQIMANKKIVYSKRMIVR